MLDTLISLSALPLLYTTPHSWSTSLNLLFFYLTWSTLLLSHPPLRVALFGTLVLRTLFFVLPSLLFLTFDTLLPSLAYALKLQARRGVSSSAVTRIRVLGWALFNITLSIVAQGVVETILAKLGLRSALRVKAALPMPGELAWGVVRAIAGREVLQYYMHRVWLHSPASGGVLARWHKEWQHEFQAPWSVVAVYDHPIVYLVGRWVPMFLPAAVLRLHLLTWFLFVAIVGVEEVVTFSGYRAVWSLLGGATRRVDRHFEYKGKGNFSTWGILDWGHGTSVGAKEPEEEAAEKAIAKAVEDARDGRKS